MSRFGLLAGHRRQGCRPDRAGLGPELPGLHAGVPAVHRVHPRRRRRYRCVAAVRTPPPSPTSSGSGMGASPRMLMILSENWTLTSGRDLPELVRWAQVAEDTGFDAVMISEHVVLGPDASANGVMGNPRDYAHAGQPGSRDALAQLADAPVGDGVGHPAPAAGGRRDHRPAAAPVAAGARAGHPRPDQRGPARRTADGELEQGRVRRPGRAVHQAGQDPRRAAGDPAARLAGRTHLLRR